MEVLQNLPLRMFEAAGRQECDGWDETAGNVLVVDSAPPADPTPTSVVLLMLSLRLLNPGVARTTGAPVVATPADALDTNFGRAVGCSDELSPASVAEGSPRPVEPTSSSGLIVVEGLAVSTTEASGT